MSNKTPVLQGCVSQCLIKFVVSLHQRIGMAIFEYNKLIVFVAIVPKVTEFPLFPSNICTIIYI